MRRTNLVLDEKLLEEARQLLGVKTYSAAVNKSLEDAIRRAKIARLPSYFGSGIWKGSLSRMREDSPKRPSKRKRV